jgi:hypothetical protein
MNEVRQLFINVATQVERIKQMKSKQLKLLTSKISIELPATLTSLTKSQQAPLFTDITLNNCKNGLNKVRVLSIKVVTLVTPKTAAPVYVFF